MKNLILNLIVCMLFCMSCNNEQEEQIYEQLSDEEISFNLLKNGSNDPELLIGEWKVVEFAYTADGKKITNKISLKAVNEYSNLLFIEHRENENQISVGYSNYLFYYLISDNLLIDRGGFIYQIYIEHTEDQLYCIHALFNAYSFVLKGNELIIYFKGKDENKNLLIAKKL